MEKIYIKELYNKFLQYSETDANIQQVNKDLSSIESFETDAKTQGFQPDYINTIKDDLINKTIDGAEYRRAAEIEELGREAESIKQQFHKKMIASPEGQQFFKDTELKYSGMSDGEIKQQFTKFINGEITDVREIDILSKHLKNVDPQSHESMRRIYSERKLSEPYRVLNPDLFDRYEKLQQLKYGEILLKVKGDSKQGRKGIYQSYSIRELL